jgi:PhnB protein
MDLNIYLFFDGQCEEAFKVYARVLGAKISTLMRYGDLKDGPLSFKGNDRVIHASLQVGDRILMGSDTPPTSGAMPGQEYVKPRGFRANIGVSTPGEAERIFDALAEGGNVTKPMAETFFAHRFGMLTDRFGTPWMVTCGKQQGAARNTG